MSGKVYFVTGANRGIGYEFVKQLAEFDSSNVIIATARDVSKAKELQEFAQSRKNIHIVTLDVSDKKSIDNLDSQIEDIAKDGIDVLISNAGIAQSFKPAIKTSFEIYDSHWKTNTLGPIFLTEALHKYLILRETKQLIYVSSLAGSISGFFPMSSSAYGLSKAALNYFVKEVSFELGLEGFTAVAVHPGVVTSDMGINAAAAYAETDPTLEEKFKEIPRLTPAESAKYQLESVVFKLTNEQNGKFLNYDGVEVPF